jgi:hypothetical protein
MTVVAISLHSRHLPRRGAGVGGQSPSRRALGTTKRTKLLRYPPATPKERR